MANIDRSAGQEPSELEGQTSINDYLKPTTAILPVKVREPTDDELAAFLSANTN